MSEDATAVLDPRQEMEQERREVETVKKRFQRAKAEKKRFSENWALYWKLVLGRHWPQTGALKDLERAKPVIQKVHQAVETRVAHLTSRRPTLQLYPFAADAGSAVELLQRVLDSVWTSTELDDLVGLSVKNAVVVGIGCLKVIYDGGLRDGKGDIDVRVIDPHHIFVSPGTVREKDADYIIQAQNVTLGYLHRLYHGDEQVKARLARVRPGMDEPELSIDVLGEADARQISAQVKGTATNETDFSGKVFMGPTDVVGSMESDDDLVTVYEEWSRRDDGELHVRVVAGSVLLDSYKSPYRDSLYPFVFYRLYPTTISFYPVGLVGQIAGLQLMINKLYAQILDIMRLTANPILLIPVESGIDPSSIKVKPGLVLPYNAGEGTRPAWLQPGPLPGEIFAAVQYFSHEIDQILGNQEILQGSAPPNIEAAKAIQALASQAGVRVEREAQWLERGHHTLARLLLSRIQQYFNDERVILTVGRDGIAEQVTLNQVVIAEGGASSLVNQITDDAVQIAVEIGASLPAVRLAEFEKTMALAEKGFYGPPQLPNGMINRVWQEQVFKAAAVLNYKNVMAQVEKVMGEAVGQAQQAAAQAAAAKGGQS